MKQTIAVDIDDVIAGSTDALRKLVNKRTGSKLTQAHYRVPDDYWGYYERVWQTHGIDGEISLISFQEEMAVDQSHIPLLPGASFALNELAKKFHIILITSRYKTQEQATRKWLKNHFGDALSDVYFTRSHVEATEKTKGELCKDLGVSWLIDDNVDYCASALANGIEAILFGEYGWHQNVPDNLILCKDWPSILDYFDGKD